MIHLGQDTTCGIFPVSKSKRKINKEARARLSFPMREHADSNTVWDWARVAPYASNSSLVLRAMVALGVKTVQGRRKSEKDVLGLL